MDNKHTIIYGLFYKDEPIYTVDFYYTDKYSNQLLRKRVSKKFYTTEGYAEGAIKQLPSYIDRKHIKVVEYILNQVRQT